MIHHVDRPWTIHVRLKLSGSRSYSLSVKKFFIDIEMTGILRAVASQIAARLLYCITPDRQAHASVVHIPVHARIIHMPVSAFIMHMPVRACVM